MSQLLLEVTAYLLFNIDILLRERKCYNIIILWGKKCSIGNSYKSWNNLDTDKVVRIYLYKYTNSYNLIKIKIILSSVRISNITLFSS